MSTTKQIKHLLKTNVFGFKKSPRIFTFSPDLRFLQYDIDTLQPKLFFKESYKG